MVDDIIVELEENDIGVTIEEMSVVVEVTNGPGPQGPPGEDGPQGIPGDQARVSFVQASPASDWVITHNLNLYPHVTVIVDDYETGAEIQYNSLDQVTVSFASPQSGRAELSG